MDENSILANTKSQKVCITAMCYISFIGYGLIISIIPQTMKDLEALMNVNTAKFSIAFAIRSIFYSFGAVFFGWLFNHSNRQIVFALNMLLCCISTVFVPIVPTFYAFLALGCSCGLALGGVDTAANVLILEMWGKDNNPFLQALHLFFALGTVVGPLMSTPFVSPDTNTTTLLNEYASQRFTIYNKLVIPYAITSAVCFIAAIGLFLCELLNPYKTPERSVSRRDRRHVAINDDNGDTELLLANEIPKSYYISVVGLAAMVVFMLLCAEPMFFNFLPAFLQRIDVEKKKSMFMSAVFAGGFTLFRFLSIFVAIKVKTTVMLYSSFTLTFVSSTAMLIFGMKSEPVLWVTSAVNGAGFACLYPALFSFVEERIDVTNIVGGIFMFAGSAATTITPLIIGYFIEQIPWIFLDFNIVCVTAMILIFVLLHFTDIWRSKYERSEVSVTVQ